MTPEELNRTIDFIIQSQARLAAAQEQDRADRLEFQKWSKDFNRQVMELIQKQNQLLEIQSRRLDEHDRQFSKILGDMQAWRHEWQKEQQQWQREQQQWQSELRADAQKQHEETLSWLQRIVEKITDRLN
jgi:nitrous oxide reductase